MGKDSGNGVELLDYKSVPTSIDSENNRNDRSQKKYTVNRSSHGSLVISRPLLFLIMACVILLLVAAVLITFFLVPRCTEAVREPEALGLPAVTTSFIKENERLPNHLHPTHYRIKMMPFIWEGNFTTNGEIIITINVTEDTNKITLNINDIIINEDDVKVLDADEETAQIITITEHIYETDKQRYSVVLDDDLKTGKIYQLHIKFTSHLNDLLQGFYRIAYPDYARRQIRWMAATQFSPTDARRAYPCFDEPSLKARFTISLARWKNMTSRSNMRIKEVSPVENMTDWIWDHYDETPIMSTYLVAMMVSDLEPFKYNSPGNNTANKIDFTIWTRREALDQTRFAGRIGPRVLEYFEKYFQIAYPLPKLDMVALPDFGFNAMENWGLINFRESSLLYSDRETTIRDKRHIATVLSHELGHQWFGNLVTPEWWDDLWLKEGFATYTEYLGAQYVQPDWNILDEFVLYEIHASFELDCLLSSHPIHVPVQHTSQIRQIFDKISYAKGASIIRMLNNVLGEYTFKVGLIKYLNAKKYGNAYHDDLWDSLTVQAHADGTLDKNITLEQIMDSWILQSGYPVVNVSRNYTDNSVTITQKRFLLSKNASENNLWWIPISYTTEKQFDFDNSKPKVWMENEPEIILEDVASVNEWIYVNIREGGYYRVNYDHGNWRMLTMNLRRFPHVVRAQLIDDAMDLARANLLEYEVPFNMLIEIFKESDPQFVSLSAVFSGLTYIDNMLATTPAYGKFKLFVTQFTRYLYDSLGFLEKPEDTYDIKMKRSDVLKWVCTLESSDCIIQARVLFRNWMNNDTARVPPNLKSVVYCTAIKEGGELEWNFAYERYLSANLATEKHELLSALGCASEPWLLSRYLEFTLTNHSGVRKQDGSIVFESVAENVAGHLLAFDFIRTHWKELNDYYGVAFSSVSKMVSSLSVYMNTPFELSQLENFKNENINKLGTSERAFDQTIEKVRYNVEWMSNSYRKVEKWLEDTIRQYRLH